MIHVVREDLLEQALKSMRHFPDSDIDELDAVEVHCCINT